VPGLTGAWQVSGRSTITNFNDVVKLDFNYIRNWSVWQDIAILFKTVPVVLFARGSA
jgi:lipopolysaccharide/colanic/teichoic acid biosynthesis glycosyltransferase